MLVKKKERLQMRPIETITIREQQSFKLYNQINPIQITIDDNRIVNIFKKNTQMSIISLRQWEYYFQSQLKMIQKKYL